MMSCMDTRELRPVTDVDQMKQGNFHKTTDLEKKKDLGIQILLREITTLFHF